MQFSHKYISCKNLSVLANIAFTQLVSKVSLMLLMLSLFVGSPLVAQRGGPGGGRDSSSIRGILGRDTYQAELNLTEEQKKKVEELRDTYQVDREAMGSLYDKMRNAKSDEERRSAQSELRKLTDVSAMEFEKAAEQMLDPKQMTRAREIYLQQAGARALMRTDYADKYQLSTEQKQKLELLSNEMEAARMQMGFRVSDEEREKFNKEWNVKMLDVLNANQKSELEKNQGTPVTSSTTSLAPVTNTVSGTTVASSTAPPKREFVDLPRDTTKKDAASFEIDAKPVVVAANKSPVSVEVDGQAEPQAQVTDKTQPKPADKLVSFNFSYAPWMDVLKQYADRNQLTLNLMDTPQGTFNYYDRKQYTPAQALDIMNGYLLTRGYCLIRKDEFLICLNIDNGIPPNLIPTVSLEDLSKHGKNEIVAVVFPVGTLDVNVLAAEVTQLVGPQGKVIPLKGAASVMVQDISQNLQRISGLIQQMTASANPEAVSFRVFKLVNIRAQQAETIVKGLSGQSTGVTNVSSSVERRSYDRDRERSQPPAPQSTQAASLTGMTMTVEPRTNSLLITATAAQFLLIDATLKAIDVPESEISPIAQLDDTTPELRVYQVYDANAREVTKTLDVIMPGIVVNEDGEKGKIHIYTTPYKHKLVEQEIKKLDGLIGTSNASVIPLVTLDPLSTTITLRSMFVADGDKAPVIEADAFGRRIIARGSDSQIAEIKSILNQLGETGEAGAVQGTYSSGPVRSISLGGRDPEQLLPLIEQIWGKSSGSKIRVVKPSERGNGILNSPMKSPEPSPANSGEELPPPRAALEQGRDELEEQYLTDKVKLYPVSLVEEVTQESGSGLTITVINGELILTGGTEEERNKLEELIRSLAQTIPVENSWTVYYLKAADATATAEMLEQLIPSSVVATTSSSSSSMLGSMTSGLTSMGSNLMDLSGLSSLGGSTTLTIVPEIRLNALFVSGPAYLVRDVEAMLEVLDAAERPESLRERQPKLIPVEHADVNEVYKIVNDVYKDVLQPNPLAALARGGGGGNNPLAMLMGQGGKGGAAAAPETKLTLGVDERTSNLIVSADDAMFREIEGLVQNIDKAALEAKRTIRIVNLQHADPTLIKNTLGTLVPRVKISTSGAPRVSSNSPPTSPGSPSSSGSSGGDNGNQDAIRQIMEQRFREAVEQRGGGNNATPQPGGGGRSFGPPGGGGSGSPFGGRGPTGGSSRGGGSSGRGR